MPLGNDVLRVIVESDLDPREFDWRGPTARAGSITTLVHASSHAVFQFGFGGGLWDYRFEPSDSMPYEEGLAGGWAEELHAVARWLRAIKRISQEPDMWAQLRAESEAIARPSSGDVANTAFDPHEIAQLVQQIESLKLLIAQEHPGADTRSQVIEVRLDYTIGVARGGIGRVDWWNLFLGTLFSLLVEQLVPPDLFRALVVLTAHALGGLFGDVPQLPLDTGPQM